jgi:3'-5' exoribonuclease
MKILLSSTTINQTVAGELAVTVAQVKTAKNNKKYLDLTMTDGFTSIVAKKWDHTGDIPETGSVLTIAATIGEFAGVKQMVIQRWDVSEDVDFNDFVMHSAMSDDELWETIMKYIDIIQDPDYKAIVKYFYENYKTPMLMAPAAKGHHHVYLGGNVEHTISVIRNALTMADENTNMSLLIAGAAMHDIGKIHTYCLNGMTFGMTDIGKLLDHIVIGITLLSDCQRVVQIPLEKYVLLQHIIASHHGQLDWGSPVVPKFREAFMVHYADKSDVVNFKMKTISEEALEDAVWSGYERSLGTEVLIQRDGDYALDIAVFRGEAND